MRRLSSATALFALVVVLAACSGATADSTSTTTTEAPSEANITMENFAFSGAESVAVGETVTITNEDSVGHTWTAVGGAFDSGTVTAGESFEFTFDEAGEYEYFCSFHPQMIGTITVEG